MKSLVRPISEVVVTPAAKLSMTPIPSLPSHQTKLAVPIGKGNDQNQGMTTTTTTKTATAANTGSPATKSTMGQLKVPLIKPTAGPTPSSSSTRSKPSMNLKVGGTAEITSSDNGPSQASSKPDGPTTAPTNQEEEDSGWNDDIDDIGDLDDQMVPNDADPKAPSQGEDGKTTTTAEHDDSPGPSASQVVGQDDQAALEREWHDYLVRQQQQQQDQSQDNAKTEPVLLEQESPIEKEVHPKDNDSSHMSQVVEDDQAKATAAPTTILMELDRNLSPPPTITSTTAAPNGNEHSTTLLDSSKHLPPASRMEREDADDQQKLTAPSGSVMDPNLSKDQPIPDYILEQFSKQLERLELNHQAELQAREDQFRQELLRATQTAQEHAQQNLQRQLLSQKEESTREWNRQKEGYTLKIDSLERELQGTKQLLEERDKEKMKMQDVQLKELRKMERQMNSIEAEKQEQIKQVQQLQVCR